MVDSAEEVGTWGRMEVLRATREKTQAKDTNTKEGLRA